MEGQRSVVALLFFLVWASISGMCLGTQPGEFSIVGYDPDGIVSELRAAEIFEQWRERHGKVYRDSAEKERRFESFKKNLAYVMERSRNGGSAGHTVGLNKFADLSNQEFREIYLSKIKKPWKDGVKSAGEDVTCEAPQSLDWRKKGAVTGVKDQGSCGEY